MLYSLFRLSIIAECKFRPLEGRPSPEVTSPVNSATKLSYSSFSSFFRLSSTVVDGITVFRHAETGEITI
jgi:hypothetical protein